MDTLNPMVRLARRLSVSLACAATLAVSVANADPASDNAAGWLVSQQITTGPSAGAFPWTPGQSAAPNTQGATALGLLRAWARSGNAAHLAAAVANGDCQVNSCVAGMTYADTHHRFATHDPLFLEQLSIASGDAQYAEFVAAEFWDRLSAGIYGASANLDAVAYANSIVASRSGQNYPDLAAWDLSKAAIAAELAGEIAARNAMMQGVLASLNASDAAHTTFDVIGLSGAIWASAATGVNLDPAAGKWAAASNTEELANLLLAYQAPGGGFVGSSSAAGGITDANADAQTTAFAVQALDAVDAVAHASEIQNGLAYISGLQQPSGQFLAASSGAPGDAGGVETHGETLEAYASLALRPQIVYVDDDFAGDLPGDAENFVHPQVNGGAAIAVVFGQDAFAAIDAALAQVRAGGTIYVAQGRYAENNLAIGKPVSIIGEKAGVDARTRNFPDANESIVVPGVAQAGLTLGSYELPVIDIRADAVIIDGLTVDADNPALSSGIAYNGADPDVAGGIYAQGSNTDLRNLVIRNVLYAGIEGYTNAGAVAGNLIHHNRFSNITRPSLWGRGIILADDFYARVTDNLMDEVRVGVQTNNNHRVAPDGFAPAISGNEIHATRTGIFHNLFYQNATTYAIADNQLIAVANAGETGEWAGLWIQSMMDAQTMIVSNNAIQGGAVVGSRPSVGYLLSNITSTASASTAIDGGNVTAVGAGVQATDATVYTGQVHDIVIRNVAFADIGLAAFYVEDTVEQAGTAKLTIGGGNSYANVPHVLTLSGSAPVVGYTDSQAGVPSVFVRSARGYYNDPGAAAHTVANASINAGIGHALASGTVSVEAGQFVQSAIVNKQVTVRGAFAGTPGHAPARTGAGETVLAPSSGSALTLAATGAVVDGFTVTVAGGVAVVPGGASRNNLTFINNRVVDIANGTAIRFEPGEGSPASGLLISGNLFANIGGSGVNGSAIQLYKGTRGASVTDNHFRSVRNIAVQVNGGNGSVLDTVISGNVVSDPLEVGSSNAFVTTNVDGMLIRDNTISGVATGLFISDKDSDLEFICNSVSGADRGISSFDFFGGLPNSAIRIFDNAIVGSVTADVNNGLAQNLVIGSNWYGGGNDAVVTGSNAFVADPLPATPIGESHCGDNTPSQVVAYAGNGQHTLVGTVFGGTVDARVEDALGGAVMGESLSLSAPAVGATAVLGTSAGTTDFNGVVSSTVTANGLAGTYAITAGSGSLSPDASFTLSNDPIIGTIAWDDLSFVYDGDTHVATAHIAEEPATLCTVNPALGPDVGTYTVTATCNGLSYAASGSRSASITPASAMLDVSDLMQTFDGTPKPVTVTSNPGGVAVNVTYNGSPTAPSAIGVYAVVATVADPNHVGPQVSNVLQIVAADAPDLGISITDNRDFVQFGKLLTYTIVVNNPGNTDISGATVTANLPITLLPASPGWQCVQVSPGAACTNGGSGNLSDTTVSIPAGGGIVYLLNAWVDDDASLPTDLISIDASVDAPGDTNGANDSTTDTTQASIFRDGVEVGGDGADDVPGFSSPDQASLLTGDHVLILDLAMARVSDGRLIVLARGDAGNAEVIQIQALRSSEHLLVRLLGKDAVSAWSDVPTATSQLVLGLAPTAQGSLVLLAGAREDLQLPVAATGLRMRLPAWP